MRANCCGGGVGARAALSPWRRAGWWVAVWVEGPEWRRAGWWLAVWVEGQEWRRAGWWVAIWVEGPKWRQTRWRVRFEDDRVKG